MESNFSMKTTSSESKKLNRSDKQQHSTKTYSITISVEDKSSHLGKFSFEIYPTMSLQFLKLQVEQEYGIPVSAQKWIFCNSLAENDNITLYEYGVVPNSTLFLYLDVKKENLIKSISENTACHKIEKSFSNHFNYGGEKFLERKLLKKVNSLNYDKSPQTFLLSGIEANCSASSNDLSKTRQNLIESLKKIKQNNREVQKELCVFKSEQNCKEALNESGEFAVISNSVSTKMDLICKNKNNCLKTNRGVYSTVDVDGNRSIDSEPSCKISYDLFIKDMNSKKKCDDLKELDSLCDIENVEFNKVSKDPENIKKYDTDTSANYDTKYEMRKAGSDVINKDFSCINDYNEHSDKNNLNKVNTECDDKYFTWISNEICSKFDGISKTDFPKQNWMEVNTNQLCFANEIGPKTFSNTEGETLNIIKKTTIKENIDEVKSNCQNLDGQMTLLKSDEENFLEKESAQNYQLWVEIDKLNLVHNTTDFICPICFCEVFPGKGVILHECLHMFCIGCLHKTVEYADEALIKCPYRDENYSCQSHLQQREIKAVVSNDVYEKYLQRSITTAESLDEKSFHCKTPDCKGWCIIDKNINIFHCPVCLHFNCLNCKVIHEGLNCRNYQEKLKKQELLHQDSDKTVALLNKMMEEGKVVKCPKCDLFLMKRWGCDWLKCSVCQTEICWVTKGPRWGPKGQGDTSAGCKCGVNGVKCHPSCTYCH